jgi:tetratricopeptide (TPR) repeat protein
LWPDEVASDDSLVHCIVELRRALGDNEKRLIRTVAGRGYRFEAQIEEERCAAEATTGSTLPSSELTFTLATAWRTLRRIPGREAVTGARQRFEREFQMNPRSAGALTGISLSHVIDVLNRWSIAPEWQVELAKEAAERALGIEPGHALAHHARAHVALLKGCHFEALVGYSKALDLDPMLVNAKLRIGLIELELGRAEATKAHVRESLLRSGGNVDFASQAAFVDGMAAFHLGRDNTALACMRRSVALHPESGQAHLWLAALDALQGREDEAAHHLSKFQRHAPGHTIESLVATERSWNPEFRAQRKRLYEGLRRAGMPR